MVCSGWDGWQLLHYPKIVVQEHGSGLDNLGINAGPSLMEFIQYFHDVEDGSSSSGLIGSWVTTRQRGMRSMIWTIALSPIPSRLLIHSSSAKGPAAGSRIRLARKRRSWMDRPTSEEIWAIVWRENSESGLTSVCGTSDRSIESVLFVRYGLGNIQSIMGGINFFGRSCNADYFILGQIGLIPEHRTTLFAGEPEHAWRRIGARAYRSQDPTAPAELVSAILRPCFSLDIERSMRYDQ
jgi:hypothetical protein